MQDDPPPSSANGSPASVALANSPAHDGSASFLPNALAVITHMPVPVIVLDAHKRIRAFSRMAEEVLGMKAADYIGQDANRALELSSKNENHARKWSADDKAIDTRFGNGRRVIFEISHVYGNDDAKLTPFATDSQESERMTYLTVSRCWRMGSLIYPLMTADGGDSPNNQSERAWAELFPKMLDIAPYLIVAVSKDGRHIYQNQHAFDTLGPQQAPHGAGPAEWIARQYAGATYPDGSLCDPEDLPLYRATIDGVAVSNYVCHFGDYVYMLAGRPLFDRNGEHVGGIAFSQDITVLKSETREAEDRFRNIADQMVDQIVFMTTGNGDDITWFNKSFYTMTGLEEGGTQSLGRGWYDSLHPDDVAPVAEAWSKTVARGDNHVFQQRLRMADGTYRMQLARANPLRDEKGEITAWLGVSTDITALAEALDAAKTATAHLSSMIQIAHVHYFVVNSQKHLSWNSMAGLDGPSVYGTLSRSTPLNTHVSEFLPEQICVKLRDLIEGKITSATDEYQVDGVWWKTQMRASSDGKNVNVVCTAIDVTDDKLKDERLARAATDRAVAVSSARFQADFLARASHELRTPMHGILGTQALMRDALWPDDHRQVFVDAHKEQEALEYLDSIKRCGDVLLVIINDLLDHAKISVGKMDIESHPFDLSVTINDVYQTARHGSQKSSKVRFLLENELPGGKRVHLGDSNRISQVILNLLSNALKFTESGEVVLRVSVEENNDPKSNVDRIRFEVMDTGIGVDQATLKRLFEPFQQADSSTARKYGGTGLGLSIARSLVVLQSGSLTLASPNPASGKGCVATCILPLERASRQALQSAQPAKLTKFEEAFDILLVEDNKVNQVIARKLLQRLGLNCTIKDNGQECLDYLESAPARLPHLILMDCQMPVMDGYDATQRIRRHHNAKIRSLPIVAMTASAIRGDREKCIGAGMQDYVSKPVNFALLTETLKKYLMPEPGKQTTANVIDGDVANTRPSLKNVKGQESSEHVAGTDPHRGNAASDQDEAMEEHIIDLGETNGTNGAAAKVE